MRSSLGMQCIFLSYRNGSPSVSMIMFKRSATEFVNRDLHQQKNLVLSWGLFGGGTAVRETGQFFLVLLTLFLSSSWHHSRLHGKIILTMTCLQNPVFMVVLKGVPTLRRLLTPVLLVASPPTHASEDGSRSRWLVRNFYIKKLHTCPLSLASPSPYCSINKKRWYYVIKENTR